MLMSYDHHLSLGMNPGIFVVSPSFALSSSFGLPGEFEVLISPTVLFLIRLVSVRISYLRSSR